MNAPMKEDFSMVGRVFFTSPGVMWSSLATSPSSEVCTVSVWLMRPIIWAMAYTPSSTASIFTPLYSRKLPKVNRDRPLTLSMPTVASRMPSPPLMRPLSRLFPLTEAITDRPKMASEKYSGAPKVMATLLIWGAKNSRHSALISPPTVEAVRAMSSARRGCPPWHMG